ncbi:twin-arginine translocation pathway signal [Mycobacterium sp. 48b]|uniref:twin-arginine translocation pathway signal n=1 Tax=Mycobacterium sp. 48b TaxID=3400426 RepID=UPI003AAC8C70
MYPVLGTLIAISLVAAGIFYARQLRPELQDSSPGIRDSVLAAASAGTVAVLSYAPESLDHDIDQAKTHLTGDFLSYYTEFAGSMLVPAAKEKLVKTSATVVQAAVEELHSDTAKVLVFVNQDTTTAAKPQPSTSASSVVISLMKVDGDWKIAKFEPTLA